MKKIFLWLMVGLMIAMAMPAAAQDAPATAKETPAPGSPQWSVGIQGGMLFPYKFKLTDTASPFVTLNDMNANTGWLLGIKAGWTPNIAKQWVTAQLEYSHLFGPNADMQLLHTDANGDVSVKFNTSTDMIFLNLILRYPEGRWHPFIGAGPGWAWVKVKDTQVNTPGQEIEGLKLKDSASQFAWQAFAGLEVDIVRNWSVDLAYRYYQINKLTLDEIELETKGQTVTFGVNFKF